MPATGTLGLYPKFRADDPDGLPLEGGKLYSYLSGTSTPQAVYADAELTTALPHPVILDSSGEALFFYGPATYKLALHDADDVPLWVIDPVTGTGGGSAQAGMGWGQVTVALQVANGAAQAAAAVFPPDVLALGLTVWIDTSLGTTRGLTHVGIGTPSQPDAWGVLTTLTAATTTSAGTFQSYSGQPQPQPAMVTLTAYGGVFDGTGSLYLTGHFCTLTPSQQVGMSYVPAAGVSVWPPATTEGAGLVELATVAEHLDGTRGDLAATPEGVQAVLDALAPPTFLTLPDTPDTYSGQGGSLLRVNAGATATDFAPAVVDASGNLGIGTTTPAAQLHLANGFTMLDRYGGSPSVIGRAAGGTLALPSASATDSSLLLVAGRGHDGSAFSTVQKVTLQMHAAETWTPTTQGTYLQLSTTTPGTTTMSPKLRLDGVGNLSLGSNTGLVSQRPGTNAQRVLTLNTGVAPSAAHPPDAIQAWVQDRGGVANKGSLAVRTEDGTSHLLGDVLGVGTLGDASLGSGASYQALSVKGSTLYVGQSSVQERAIGGVTASFVSSTDATRTGRLTVSAYDATAAREGLRVEADGSAARLGFFGASAIVRPTVPAAATDAATTQTLANSLRTALVTLGLCG